jgi:hypothetical protein
VSERVPNQTTLLGGVFHQSGPARQSFPWQQVAHQREEMQTLTLEAGFLDPARDAGLAEAAREAGLAAAAEAGLADDAGLALDAGFSTALDAGLAAALEVGFAALDVGFADEAGLV